MKKALFLGYVWPEPKTTAAGHRMIQLLQAFQNDGFQITFASAAQQSPYSENLKTLGIKTKAIRLNDGGFDSFIAALAPNVVVFDRFMVEEQFGWRVAENAPQAIRILNTEDLHSLRESRESCLKQKLDFTEDLWLQNDKTKREVASIYRSDLSLLVSSYETDLLKNQLQINASLLLNLPLFYDPLTSEDRRHWLSFAQRNDFLMVGNGKHAPNVDAVHYLKNDIWPLIRERLPNAQLHCYGAYLPKSLTEMHNPKTGFLVHGWVDDLDVVMRQVRVQLAPLRFGAGIKGKLLDGLRNGLPTVSTNIGVEGMQTNKSFETLTAEEPIAFAHKAVSLYTDESLWSHSQNVGTALLHTAYAKEALTQRLFGRIAELQNNLVKHRRANFIGGMLQHSSLAATKYLAKWIEAKNRKD